MSMSAPQYEPKPNQPAMESLVEPSLDGWVGRELGCNDCVLPEGYAGTYFLRNAEGAGQCGLCAEHKTPVFLGGDKLLADLDLSPSEKVGVVARMA